MEEFTRWRHNETLEHIFREILQSLLLEFYRNTAKILRWSMLCNTYDVITFATSDFDLQKNLDMYKLEIKCGTYVHSKYLTTRFGFISRGT